MLNSLCSRSQIRQSEEAASTRRQDSITGGGGGGGGRNKFWGGTRSLYSRVDQPKQVKTKKKKRSSIQLFPQNLVVVSKFLRFSTNS